MSVEYDERLNSPQSTPRHTKSEDNEGAKKRKRGEQADFAPSPPKKKHRQDHQPSYSKHTISSSKTRETNHASSFVRQTSSLYLPLPPIAQAHPLQGLCAEHLSPLILTYYPPLRGVIISFHRVTLSTLPYGESATSGEPVLARTIDEYAAPHVWLTADFLLFRPTRGNIVEGWINLQNEGNIGLVCMNFFTASIEKKRLPKDWRWIPGGLEVGRSKKKLKGSERGMHTESGAVEAVTQINGFNDVQGHFQDGDGRRVEGLIRFAIRDVETSRSSGGDNSFLSIEGTLIEDNEEETVRESGIRDEEKGAKKRRRKATDEAYAMSGAVIDDENGDKRTSI